MKEFQRHVEKFGLYRVSDEKDFEDFKPGSDMSRFPFQEGTVVIGEISNESWDTLAKVHRDKDGLQAKAL